MPTIRPNRPRNRVLAALLALPALLVAAGCGYGSKAVEDADPKAMRRQEGRRSRPGEGRLLPQRHPRHATGRAAHRRAHHQGAGRDEDLHSGLQRGPLGHRGPQRQSRRHDLGRPLPSINGYAQSHGKNLRIVSGATSGGASLVVDPKKVKSLSDLKGKKIATPQLGNTQDVALLHYLKGKGIKVDPETGKGATSVLRQDNKEIPTTFQQGASTAPGCPSRPPATWSARAARSC